MVLVFFNLTKVIDRYDVISHFKSLSVLGEVFVGAPKPDFLFDIIPGGNNTTDLFN